jgi:hypothetical protein
VLSTYKEVLLLFCDNTEFGVAESPVDVEAEADPRKLPVPEISCQLENHAEHKRLYQIRVQTAKDLTNSIRQHMTDVHVRRTTQLITLPI